MYVDCTKCINVLHLIGVYIVNMVLLCVCPFMCSTVHTCMARGAAQMNDI